MTRALVRIFGPSRWDGSSGEIVAEFLTDGLSGEYGYSNRSPGACHLFVLPVDYSGLGNPDSMPRAGYAYPLFIHGWNTRLRRGSYFSAPFKGRIEIEAV